MVEKLVGWKVDNSVDMMAARLVDRKVDWLVVLKDQK